LRRQFSGVPEAHNKEMFAELPKGSTVAKSKEQVMANESLARIMYGTSDEHVSTVGSALSGLAPLSASQNSAQIATDDETFGELLHRVWLNVSGKR
jgi:hypothetical protein